MAPLIDQGGVVDVKWVASGWKGVLLDAYGRRGFDGTSWKDVDEDV